VTVSNEDREAAIRNVSKAIHPAHGQATVRKAEIAIDTLVSHGWGPRPAESPKFEMTLSETRDALWFVASRYLRDGVDGRRYNDRCTGISSDALAFYGIGMRREPKDHEYPADRSDLDACERTYEMAPAPVRRRMLPVLEKFRAARRECGIEVIDD